MRSEGWEFAMEVEFELTMEDLEALQRFNQKQTSKLKPDPVAKMVTIGFGTAAIVVVFLPYWFTEHARSYWFAGFCNGWLGGILITFAWGWVLAQLGKSTLVRRYWDREECRWYFARRRVKISAGGFDIANEFQQAHYSWS